MGTFVIRRGLVVNSYRGGGRLWEMLETVFCGYTSDFFGKIFPEELFQGLMEP
jgi:hypothetical protein